MVYARYAYTRVFSQNETGRGQIAIVNIEQGDSFNTVTRKLEMKGVLGGFMGLPDRWLFRYIATSQGNSHQVKSGAYQFDCNQSLNSVYEKLTKGSKDFKLTIPEGKTAKETADIVNATIATFKTKTFLDLVESTSTIAALGFDTEVVNTLEGYLYPDTYFYTPDMNELDIIKLMTAGFKTKIGPAMDKLSPTTDTLTFQQHLIMASLIEKEARSNSDRPLVASVLFNRISKKMPLQIDATLQYAKGDFATPPRAADKQILSPYNTYKIKGLPPGPICSPRLESIMATYNTPKTDYLYYVYKGNGEHAFAKTYEEHRANIERYLKNSQKDKEQTEAMTEEAVPDLE